MGIRETLNKNPAITTAGTIVIILIALGVITWEMLPKSPVKIMSGMYYTDDDGQSTFVDLMNKNPPFDHGGKSAMLAAVFSCNGGKQWVAYVQKYTDDMKATLDDPNHSEISSSDLESNMLVKKPGDTEWLTLSSTKGRELTNVKCPDGTLNGLIRVLPQ
ncbi:MAG: hypothetical protein ABR964_03915 [Tepidisphaeraceae bacterium]